MLEELKGCHDNWWRLQPLIFHGNHLFIDTKELSFILSSPSPDLLNRLFHTDSEFRTIIKILDVREKSLIYFRQKLLEIEKAREKEISIEEITPGLAPMESAELISLTNGLYEVFKPAIEVNRQIDNELVQFILSYFRKKHNPLIIKFPE